MQDPVEHPVGVEEAVVDPVEVMRADGPGGAARRENRGVAHQRVGLEEVVGDRGEEDVFRPLPVDRELDLHPAGVLAVVREELARVAQRRLGDRRRVVRLSVQLLPHRHLERLRHDADLRQDPAAEVGDHPVVDPERALELAPAAGGAAVEILCQPVDVLLREGEGSAEARLEGAEGGEVAGEDVEEQLRPLARNVPRIAGGLVDRTAGGAASASRAHPGIEVENGGVIRVRENRGECLEEPLREVPRVDRLHVIGRC